MYTYLTNYGHRHIYMHIAGRRRTHAVSVCDMACVTAQLVHRQTARAGMATETYGQAVKKICCQIWFKIRLKMFKARKLSAPDIVKD